MTDCRIVHLSVEEKTLEPTLLIRIQFSYVSTREALMGFSGELRAADATVLGQIVESVRGDERAMYLVPYGDKLDGREQPREFQMQTTLICRLSLAAIEHIEKCRASNRQRKVELNFRFRLRRLDLPGVLAGGAGNLSRNPFAAVNIDRFELSYPIEQSTWVNEFAGPLGIGDLVVIELAIPVDKVPEQWKEVFGNLIKHVGEMRLAMQQHDWKKLLLSARQFYENIKFDERHANRLLLKNELKAMFRRQQFNDDAFNSWYSGVLGFFDYTSKFIHTLDQRGTAMPEPIPSRDDAQFVYALSVTTLNLLFHKLRS